MPLLDVNSSRATMIKMDVAHEGTTSVIHISVARMKMAMTRCWTTVKSAMPNTLAGKFQITRVTTNRIIAVIRCLFTDERWLRFSRLVL